MQKRINISDIPEKAFVNAVQKRLILKVRPMSRAEKKANPPGSPDIVAIFPDGTQNTVTRDYILNGFTYISGKKIQIMRWTCEGWYTVVKNINEHVVVTRIPRNYIANTYKGNISQQYIVINNVDGNESLEKNGDAEGYIALSPKIFKKMYIILPDFRASYARKIADKRAHKRAMATKNAAMRNRNTSMVVNREPQTVQKKQSDTKRILFTAKARLVDKDKNIVGFLMINNSDKSELYATKLETMNYCLNKQVINIMAAKREDTGNTYLKGNGIKIESLPEIEML